MHTAPFIFPDRAEAGRLLARALDKDRPDDPIVYALPRGGVPVAVEIAEHLKAPLDLILVRKLGAPGQPEVALGAVVEGDEDAPVINDRVRRISGADDRYLETTRLQAVQEMRRRRASYLGTRPRLDPSGRTVIVVDDGLATGATMKAALGALRRQGARRIIVALPVAPLSALDDLAPLADKILCLQPARHFLGVGAFFSDFHQLTDSETRDLLNRIWQPGTG